MAAVPGQLCFGGRNTPIFLRGASSSCLNNNYELQKSLLVFCKMDKVDGALEGSRHSPMPGARPAVPSRVVYR